MSIQKNIAVSGSSGFIGSNLIPYLTGQGLTIFSVIRDEKAVEKARTLNFSNLTASYIDQHSIDVVIHLAGKAHDVAGDADEEEYMTVNTGLTRKIYDSFLASNASLFIYMSSVKAVTDHSKEIVTEAFVPNPQTSYGRSKNKAEEYILSKDLPDGKRVIILRPCMVHGPGNKGNMNLLYQFIANGNPYPLGVFDNRRSFLSIENLCFAINGIVMDPSIPSGVYHVADDEPLSTVEIIKEIGAITGIRPRIWKINASIIIGIVKIGDRLRLPINSEWFQKLTENYIVSNVKLIKALKKELPISSREGIRKTIQSLK